MVKTTQNVFEQRQSQWKSSAIRKKAGLLRNSIIKKAFQGPEFTGDNI